MKNRTLKGLPCVMKIGITRNLFILCFLMITSCTAADSRVSKTADAEEAAPSYNLAIPMKTPSSEAAVSYLGIENGSENFNLNEINTDVLVIEVFNMYCIHCQRAATKVNDLYDLMENSGFSHKVKIIGVGRANSSVEVDSFRNKYGIEFPLFPDKDRWIVQALQVGQVGTPHFLVFKMNPNGTWNCVHAGSGGFDSPQAFLDVILERSDLE